MNKPEDYGVNILITPELIEAIEIVRGPTEPHAVGKLPTKKHLEAVVAAFMDAMVELEAVGQQLDQAITAGESCLPPSDRKTPLGYMMNERPDISLLDVPKATLADTRLTIKYVNEKLGRHSNSALREGS
jgi:hypothetical protein